MPARRSITTLISVAVTSALALTVSVGTVDARVATPAPTPPVVTVTNSGDPATAVDLAPVRTVGTQTVVTISDAMIGVDSWPGGSTRYDVSSVNTQRFSVTGATPDGGFSTVAVIEAVDVTVNEGGPDTETNFGADPLRTLIGLPIEQTISGQNIQLSVQPAPGATPTPEQADVVADYASLGHTDPFVLPDSPVGIGATWTTILSWPATEFRLPVTYSYTLESIQDGRYVVSFSWTADLAAATVLIDLQGSALSGSITGTGSIAGNTATFDSTVNDQEHVRLVLRQGGQESVAEYDYWSASTTVTS